MPASSVSDTRAYSFIYQQDYKGVFNGTDAERIATKLVDWSAKTGSYLSIDIEDYVTDEGEHLILCGGVSDRPGRARVFVLDHPSQKDRPKEERDEVLKWFLYLCSHAKVHITIHYGCSDKYKLALAYGIEMPGFDFDTLLAEFFAYPDRKSFGLSGIADARYPEFAGYKTMILPHILKPEAYDVKVCQSMLDKKDMNALYKWIFKTGMFSFSLIPIDVLIAYNGADCDLALRVYKDTYDKISLPLMKIYVLMSFLLYEMEPNGPLVDSDYSAKIEKLYTYKFGKAKERLIELAEDPNFNPASPVQLMKVMYDKLEIPYPFNGKPNTQKATLEALQAKYEFPRLIIGFRKLSKALSTYIVGYRKCAAVNRGRLRTKWWLTGTATGRLSSGGGKDGDEGITNLQNIHGDKHIQNIIVAETEWRDTYRLIDSHLKKCDIKMSEYDALVKRTKSDDANEVLIAKDDLKKWLDGKAALLKPIEAELGEYHMFLEFDEAQVEVRVMAMLSGDENLIADCLSGDIHSTVGHAMTGWPVERIKKDKKTRTITKNLHFGLLFGLSAKGLLAFILAKDNTSKISLEDVERYVANYFKRYPKVKLFVENQRAFALEHGYVQTLFGFRRTLNTEELSEDEKEAAAAAGFNGDFGSSGYWGNVAINMPVQGTAHQLMIAALSNLITQREKYAVLGVPQMEVHDAVIWRIKIKHLAECYPLGRYLLEKEGLNTIKEYFPDIEWLVPLEVDCKGGIRYGTKVDIPTPDPLQFCFDWFLVCRSQIRELALDMRVLDQDKGV
jgi:DNA polymerase I-like protein with 3'-5' exonuclease and polymerase domains